MKTQEAAVGAAATLPTETEVAVEVPVAPDLIRFTAQLFHKYMEICADRELERMIEEGVPEDIAEAVLDLRQSGDDPCDLDEQIWNQAHERVMESAYNAEVYACFIAKNSDERSDAEEDLCFEAINSLDGRLVYLVHKEVLKTLVSRAHDSQAMWEALKVLIAAEDKAAAAA